MKKFLKYCTVISILSGLVFSAWSDASAGFKISDGDKSLEIYGRIQPRFEWKKVDNSSDTEKHNGNDFYVRRSRVGFKVKMSDEISGKLEWKLDNYLQETKTPETKLENAYVSFDQFDSKCIWELGLQNSVFSREGQLSDSKLLFDNRSTIVDKLASEGLADNATGLDLKGKLAEKHLEYGIGIYEGGDGGGSDSKEGNKEDSLLYAFEVVYHIFDPESMAGSHVGDGKKYLTIGAYYTAQNREFVTASETYDISAYGADIFGQFGTATFSAGYFVFEKDYEIGADPENDGFYVEGAYLIPLTGGKDVEFAARYQSYTPDEAFLALNNPEQKQTSLGLNYYIKKHDAKVQATYNINEKDDDHGYNYDPGDNFVVQVQLAW
jgi:hypothetical protein